MLQARPISRNVVLIALLSLVALPSCRQAQPEDDGLVNDAANAVTDMVPDLARSSRDMGREEFLDAVGAAASAFAVGADDGDRQSQLEGRQFAIRLPFACSGPTSSDNDSPLRMTARDTPRSVEVRAMPDIDASSAGVSGLAAAGGPAVQAVEGFWFEWPWLRAEQCPTFAAQTPADPNMTLRPTDQEGTAQPTRTPDRTVGIAQYFTDQDSRLTKRSGRDYRKVVSFDAGQSPPKGLFLLLHGRLRAWPDGKVIRCFSRPEGGRPTCVAGATIDRVVIERADDRTVLAEWTSS